MENLVYLNPSMNCTKNIHICNVIIFEILGQDTVYNLSEKTLESIIMGVKLVQADT